MTRKETILEMFTDETTELSCNQIVKIIIAKENLVGNKAKYLSGSISSILNKLVKQYILGYSSNKTFRGGYKYKKIFL